MLAFAHCRPSSRHIRGMQAAFLSATLGLAGAVTAGTANAEPPNCAPHSDILAHFAEQFDEAPVAAGLTSEGSLLEILSSRDNGTWTMIVIRPDGMSCFVANGEAWREVETLAIDEPQI